jgi:hypothetical protein
MSRPPVAPIARFVQQVRQVGDCWEWTGSLTRLGYAQFWDGARRIYAHRWSYEYHVAAIPSGLVVDHLCRNRACVNPWHMEPVTARENTLRGDGPTAEIARRRRCPLGHEYEQTAAGRVCRTCSRARYARYRAKKRGAPAT